MTRLKALRPRVEVVLRRGASLRRPTRRGLNVLAVGVDLVGEVLDMGRLGANQILLTGIGTITIDALLVTRAAGRAVDVCHEYWPQ